MSIEYKDIIGTFEQKKAAVAQFNLIDDTFFSVVMENKEACEYLLEKILGRPFKVIKNKTQYSIRNIEDRSVILDLLTEDPERELCNMEVHTGIKINLPKRARYHQTAIDWSVLEKGTDYNKLPDTYIIFITDEDHFKLGRNRYEIVKYIKDTDVIYDNGTHLLFLNTEVQDGTDLSELLQYIKKSDADNDKFGALSKAVKYHKTNEQGVGHMCKLMEEFAEKYAEEYAEKYAEKREAIGRMEGRTEGRIEGIAEGALKGRAEGVKEGKVETIRNMLSKGISLEEALSLTQLDRKTYEEFSGRI